MKKGALSGTVHTFTSNGTCPTVLGNLATVAPGEAFVITQICLSAGNITTSTLGPVTSPISWSALTPPCVDFNPGIAVPAGDTISCNSAGATAMVTGVTVKP